MVNQPEEDGGKRHDALTGEFDAGVMPQQAAGQRLPKIPGTNTTV